ncbi:hypothetical protein GCM10022402_21940 [Salinactinospora qingdaonensis]|uniref:Uncharacterized protein n=1 Tax=Salinactinospora qingdaonensis TaxID=702744 RepID=A0ABP7FK30_9ACTN
MTSSGARRDTGGGGGVLRGPGAGGADHGPGGGAARGDRAPKEGKRLPTASAVVGPGRAGSGAAGRAGQEPSISVTSAAMGERSERFRVMWENNG